MISTAEKVAELLFAFDAGPGGRSTDRSVSELARLVGRERSQVSRMLKSLKQANVVEQDPESRRYRLGWRIGVLAAQSGDQILVRAARPMMQTLVARTGEVALLSIQEGNRSLTVMREESQNSLRAGGWVGRRSPMHCTASGRVLMFDADDELVEALTANDFDALERRGHMPPRTIDELLERLRMERRQGHTCASEEVEVGLTSIGVPVRNVQGHILAAVNVSGPTSRMIGRVESIAMLLKAASAAISKSLATRPIT